jgi:hypothetical protein
VRALLGVGHAPEDLEGEDKLFERLLRIAPGFVVAEPQRQTDQGALLPAAELAEIGVEVLPAREHPVDAGSEAMQLGDGPDRVELEVSRGVDWTSGPVPRDRGPADPFGDDLGLGPGESSHLQRGEREPVDEDIFVMIGGLAGVAPGVGLGLDLGLVFVGERDHGGGEAVRQTVGAGSRFAFDGDRAGSVRCVELILLAPLRICEGHGLFLSFFLCKDSVGRPGVRDEAYRTDPSKQSARKPVKSVSPEILVALAGWECAGLGRLERP